MVKAPTSSTKTCGCVGAPAPMLGSSCLMPCQLEEIEWTFQGHARRAAGRFARRPALLTLALFRLRGGRRRAGRARPHPQRRQHRECRLPARLVRRGLGLDGHGDGGRQAGEGGAGDGARPRGHHTCGGCRQKLREFALPEELLVIAGDPAASVRNGPWPSCCPTASAPNTEFEDILRTT